MSAVKQAAVSWFLKAEDDKDSPIEAFQSGARWALDEFRSILDEPKHSWSAVMREDIYLILSNMLSGERAKDG